MRPQEIDMVRRLVRQGWAVRQVIVGRPHQPPTLTYEIRATVTIEEETDA